MNNLYRVRPSKKAKRLALRLDPIERVFELVVPQRCSMQKAYDFADQYEDWMNEKLLELPPLIYFEDGATIPLNGKDMIIRIDYNQNYKKTNIFINNNILQVETNKLDPSVRIVRWLKTYSKELLEVKSKEKSLSICKKIDKVSVKDTKSRWGSCSSESSISYSWRLIFAPPEALDYVVAHEVAHLKYLDHSKRFWALCRELSENYTEGKHWMRAHGHELMRYTDRKLTMNPEHLGE